MQVEVGQHRSWLQTAVLVGVLAYLGWWVWHQWNRPVVHAGDSLQMSAATRWQAALDTGDYAVAYAYLHPAQQATMDEATFAACMARSLPVRTAADHVGYSIMATSRAKADVAGTSVVDQDATNVTVQSGPAGGQMIRITWPMFDVGGPPWSRTEPGQWRTSLSGSSWSACTGRR
jgi:hypothetical protein